MDTTATDAKAACGIQTYFTPGMSLQGLVKVSGRTEADRRNLFATALPYRQAKDISLMLLSLLLAQVLSSHGLTYF